MQENFNFNPLCVLKSQIPVFLSSFWKVPDIMAVFVWQTQPI